MPRHLTTRQARRLARMRKTHSGGPGRPSSHPRHGTDARYRGGCRCEKCHAFMANYERVRKARIAVADLRSKLESPAEPAASRARASAL